MAKKKIEEPTKEQVKAFDMLAPMLQSFLNEVRVLSKTKPNEPPNQMKIKMINRILVQVKDVLTSDPSVDYLDLLDEETLPQNSDAVLILGQYDAAMAQFKEKNFRRRHSDSYEKEWVTKGLKIERQRDIGFPRKRATVGMAKSDPRSTASFGDRVCRSTDANDT